jgi:Mce-associated membrane protein
MTSSPSPTWYEVLGVPRDATPDQIKAAWRTATDKFEPGSGSGQFRLFNEAADVLLDPPRRAAYDASLEADDVDTDDDHHTDDHRLDEVQPVPPPAVVDEQVPDAPEQPRAGRPRRQRRVRSAAPAGEPASRRLLVLALVLTLLAVGAVVAAVFFGLKVRTDARVADARDEAPAAAERAAKAVLAYDYRHLPTDRKRASAYLSDSFRKTYLKNFSLLEKQKDGSPGAAVQTKTVVTASVVGSGVMDAEPDVVRVLVYVNQTSTKPGKDPQIFQNRVAMTMEKDGGRWLVDDLKSY